MHLSVPLRLEEGAVPPAYAKPGDAGADLSSRDELTLGPGERALVRTGVSVAIPTGCAALVHPRSGLAARHGVSILNAPGTIDSGYRGEILVNLINLGSEPFAVGVGDRIAQLVIVPVHRAEFVPVDSLPESDRGETGHGSSGGFSVAADPPDHIEPDPRETD